MNERDTNFFRPLWIRLVVTGIVVVWCALELIFSRDPMWITITGIGIVYCVWSFFIAFPKTPAASSESSDKAPPPA